MKDQVNSFDLFLLPLKKAGGFPYRPPLLLVVVGAGFWVLVIVVPAVIPDIMLAYTREIFVGIWVPEAAAKYSSSISGAAVVSGSRGCIPPKVAM